MDDAKAQKATEKKRKVLVTFLLVRIASINRDHGIETFLREMAEHETKRKSTSTEENASNG